MELKIKKERCPQNHPCPAIKVCPVGAMKQVGNGAPEIDYEKCISCGMCARACGMRALVLE